MQAKEFKVSLIGPSGAGKTAFIEKLIYGQPRFTHNSIRKTVGVDVTPFDFRFNGNKYRINFWDCAGDYKYAGLSKNYLTRSNLVILFDNQNLPNNSEFINWIPRNTPYIKVTNNSTENILKLIKNKLL